MALTDAIDSAQGDEYLHRRRRAHMLVDYRLKSPAGREWTGSVAPRRWLTTIGTRILIAAFGLLVAGGCATRLNLGDQAGTGALLTMQRPALDPHDGGRMVPVAELKPGDILLSSAPNLRSAAVQLLTLAPVSHALVYAGEGKVVEAAVGAGVRERTMEQVLGEKLVVVAFRHPDLSAEQAAKVIEFSRSTVGMRYNYLGIVLQVPFSLERRFCEVPLLSATLRDLCIRGVGTTMLGAARKGRFFCSQLVLEAYRQAGLPITDAKPHLISPADILHMREGDVPSVRVRKQLVYVGHLKVGHLKFSTAPESLTREADVNE